MAQAGFRQWLYARWLLSAKDYKEHADDHVTLHRISRETAIFFVLIVLVNRPTFYPLIGLLRVVGLVARQNIVVKRGTILRNRVKHTRALQFLAVLKPSKSMLLRTG